jgi:hypothetical protein
MQTIKQQWTTYLNDTEKPGRLLANKLWNMIADQNISVIPPCSWPLEDGGFMFAWDNPDHHLDIEILPDGFIEWFYRNRKTEAYDGEDNLSQITEKFKQYLEIFNK